MICNFFLVFYNVQFTCGFAYELFQMINNRRWKRKRRYIKNNLGNVRARTDRMFAVSRIRLEFNEIDMYLAKCRVPYTDTRWHRIIRANDFSIGSRQLILFICQKRNWDLLRLPRRLTFHVSRELFLTSGYRARIARGGSWWRLYPSLLGFFFKYRIIIYILYRKNMINCNSFTKCVLQFEHIILRQIRASSVRPHVSIQLSIINHRGQKSACVQERWLRNCFMKGAISGDVGRDL